ncbi:MAG: hypothetical protein ABWK05_02740 [Pyrobaculum sp.]
MDKARIVMYIIVLVALTTLVVYSSPLYDVVVNYTAPLKQVPPDYVLNINNCNVYVYVVEDLHKPKSPLTLYLTYRVVVYNETKYRTMHNETLYKRLPPLSQGEDRLVLDKLLELFGTDVEVVWNRVRVNASSWSETTHIKAKNAQELKDKLKAVAGQEVVLHLDELKEAFRRGHREVAWVYTVRWRLDDVVLDYDPPNRVVIYTTNITKTSMALSKVERQLGRDVYRRLYVEVWLGSYFTRVNETALRNAAMQLEREMGTIREYRDENGMLRGAEGLIHILVGELGPVYLIFPFPNGTAPDKATVEKVVKRFIELSGWCQSPIVAEFWPKTGVELLYAQDRPTPLLLPVAVAAVAALAIAVGMVGRRA